MTFSSFVSYSSFNHICKCLDSTANRAILSLLFQYSWRALYMYVYIYINAFSRCFYPKRIVFRLNIFVNMCVPWELNPQPFALLMQCSTTEPQEYYMYAYMHVSVCVSVCIYMCVSMKYASRSIANDTIHMKQLAMWYNSPLLRCSAIQFRFNTMRFDAMEKIWSLLFLWFRQTANHKCYVSSDF